MKKIIFGIIILALSSCVPYYYPITQGKITTDGVEIRAEDGSFTIKSGEYWNAPYSSNQGLSKTSMSSESYEWVLRNMPNAKKVRVKIPYQKEELYGVFILWSKYKDCSGPASRSYQISIPNTRVQQAKGGKVSLVYEFDSSCSSKNKAAGDVTWALWLSDMPFQTTPSKGGPLRAR